MALTGIQEGAVGGVGAPLDSVRQTSESQNSALQTATPEVPALTAMVVIQFGDRSLKGYTDRTAWSEAAFDKDDLMSPPVLLLGAEQAQCIPLREAKAAFFVHSFEGMGQDALRFHDHLAHADRIWVRVIFHDDEVVEGMVENSRDFLVRSSFLLVPNDPEGNNSLVFVPKQQIKAFHILGVRSSA